MTRHTGSHVFVDETKSRDYVMAAAAVLPGELVESRKALRSLLLPGAQRLHFTHEKPARRRQLIAAMGRVDVQVTLYVARTRDHVGGRQGCMKSILDDVLQDRAEMLVLERDESVEVADRRTIADRFRLEPAAPRYRHLSAREEPLLWISDAVAWCAQRGGEWRQLVEPLVVDEREV